MSSMSSMGDKSDNVRSDLRTNTEPSELGSKDDVSPSVTQKRPYKVRADVWEHFTKIKFDKNGKAERAACNYCGADYVCISANGTSTLRKHINNCRKYPYNEKNKNQKILSFHHVGQGDNTSLSSNLVSWSFNQEAARIAFAKMLIMDELPFKFIEREGFRQFMNIVQPNFKFVLAPLL